MTELDIPSHASLEVKAVWQGLAEAHRHLAELKGLCESLPNRAILLDTLAIQEAKDSSEIENIITTHDELYKAISQASYKNPAAQRSPAPVVSTAKPFPLGSTLIVSPFPLQM